VINCYQTGGHDNGYTSTLNYLENEGLLGKIILLNGYKNLAMDVRNLNLPQLKIEGLFMDDKLSASTYTSPAKAMQRLQPDDPDKYRISSQSPPMQLSSPSKLSKMVYGIILSKYSYSNMPYAG
jgi:hypothetical protein